MSATTETLKLQKMELLLMSLIAQKLTNEYKENAEVELPTAEQLNDALSVFSSFVDLEHYLHEFVCTTSKASAINFEVVGAEDRFEISDPFMVRKFIAELHECAVLLLTLFISNEFEKFIVKGEPINEYVSSLSRPTEISNKFIEVSREFADIGQVMVELELQWQAKEVHVVDYNEDHKLFSETMARLDAVIDESNKLDVTLQAVLRAIRDSQHA